jgi:Tfp pilus assembly protein PilN
MTDVAVTRPNGISGLIAAWDRLSRWWLRELRECIPSAWRQVLTEGSRSRLYVWPANDHIRCRLVDRSKVRDGQFDAVGFNLAALDEWLASSGVRRDTIEIGVAVDANAYFQRSIKLPASEVGALERVLTQEIVHRTPFQIDQIWQGATLAEQRPAVGVLTFRHWILPRERLDATIARLNLAVDEVSFIAALAQDGTLLRVASLKPDTHRDPPWVARTIRTLAAVMLGAAILGLTAFDYWSSSKAAALEQAVSEAKQAVQDGQQGQGPALKLLALKADPGVLAVWDELSRIIPDTTFLTEVRMVEGTLTLSGLSSDAARLVRILDGSRLFAGAALAGPITPDATEKKDRFRLTLKLRRIGVPRAAELRPRVRS